MQEFPDNQVSRNTKNSSTIICSFKFLLKCSGQPNWITNYFLVYLPHHIISSTCSAHLHATQHFNRELWNPSLLPVWEKRAGTAPISYHHHCQETEAALQTSGKKKSYLCVLNPAYILPTITRTQGPSCIQHYIPYFCILLLLWEVTIYCHWHETKLGEE